MLEKKSSVRSHHKDRQMVEAFVERLEIKPETKTGVIYLLADLEGALLSRSERRH